MPNAIGAPCDVRERVCLSAVIRWRARPEPVLSGVGFGGQRLWPLRAAHAPYRW